MYYKFLAQKDSFISKLTGSANFGKDEILEIGRDVYDNTAYPLRTLIHFDITSISQSIVDNIIGTGSKFELRLYECNSNNYVLEDFYVDAYMITSSWTEGTGSLYGAYKSGAVSWDSASIGTPWNTPGGTFNTSISASQYFPSSSGDLSIDVTELISGSIVGTYSGFNGILIKLRDESTAREQGPLLYFSKQTHTIYDPSLYAKWEDAFSTASISSSENYENYVISLRRPKAEYSYNDKVYFELFSRNYYPTLGFSQSIEQISSIPLTSLFYGIRDTATNEMVIPFDTYTSCSYDNSKNYFYFNMNNLQKNRYYDILLKHEYLGSHVEYFVHKFKVV